MFARSGADESGNEARFFGYTLIFETLNVSFQFCFYGRHLQVMLLTLINNKRGFALTGNVFSTDHLNTFVQSPSIHLYIYGWSWLEWLHESGLAQGGQPGASFGAHCLPVHFEGGPVTSTHTNQFKTKLLSDILSHFKQVSGGTSLVPRLRPALCHKWRHSSCQQILLCFTAAVPRLPEIYWKPLS